MKKKTLFILIVLLSVILSTAAASAFQLSAEKQFDDHITIDGRTYKVSPEFEIPEGIDKDSPVKLNFSDQTHELLSIERLIEDDSNNNEMEYHFGIVNAITRANTDLEYRVYIPFCKFYKTVLKSQHCLYYNKECMQQQPLMSGRVLIYLHFAPVCR